MCDWKGSPRVQFDTLLTKVLSVVRGNKFPRALKHLTLSWRKCKYITYLYYNIQDYWIS